MNLAKTAETSTTERAVTDLLSRGADPNACCDVFDDSNSALHQTAYQDNAIVASALIAAGANIETKNIFERTPLHEVGEFNAVKVAGILLDAGADVEAREFLGNTPLHIAATFGSLEVAKILVSRGADKSAKNGVGGTDFTPKESICPFIFECSDETILALMELLS